MGALNHNQNLYRTRPWELNKTITFDIFSIETPLLKVETLRNIDIVRVSPLMVEGFRFLLNDISRYSYIFFNYKSNNNINLKINNIINLNLNWIKLINFLKYNMILCINNINIILLNNLNIKFKLGFIFDKKNINSLFYYFLSDTIDLLSIKNLFNFTTKVFGYNIIYLSQNISINLINKLKNFILKKTINNNIVNLDLNISKIMNFYMNNYINIINIKKNINNIKKSISFFIYFNYIFKFFINSNFKFYKLNILKLKNFIDIYTYLNNKIISKKSDFNFFGNFNNFNKLNINKILNNKSGIFFLNTNTDFNLNFMGYKKNIIDSNKNFNFNDFISLIDISSFINWNLILNNKSLKLKTFNFNFIISQNNLEGLNIPINSILSVKNLIYFNIYGNIVNSMRIINTKPFTKSINLILKTLLKNI